VKIGLLVSTILIRNDNLIQTIHDISNGFTNFLLSDTSLFINAEKVQKLEAGIAYFDKMSDNMNLPHHICRLGMPMYPKKVVKIFTNWHVSSSLFLHLTGNLGQDSDALDAARLHDKVGERDG
jgi:hypothetical protein